MVTPQDSTHRCKSWSVKYLSCYNLCRHTRINISTTAQPVVNISFIDPLDSFIVCFFPDRAQPSVAFLALDLTTNNHSLGEQEMAQWWERSPPTSVAGVQIPASAPYVGRVCCWFPPLLREVFLRVLRFSPLLKNQHFFKFQFDQESGRRRTTLWMCYL